jgi:adenylate cyclase
MTTASVVCGSCGVELAATAKFCSECGAPVRSSLPAEYKQVTVLFADVVHSMDIAAAVGAERLREIMTDLFNRSSAVVQRYGGTVDKFTGDGIMAVFGAPIALEDHALRACLAALDVQREVGGLAVDVEVRLRVGLNSGEVIAGEVGSGPLSYTAIGEQVGMAQRMESAAPPAGVMLSESTARLVEDSTVLGEPEMVQIKGSDTPVVARQLLATPVEGGRPLRRLSTLVGRDWEMSTITGILEQSINGKGRIVGLVAPPGIGKSRMVAEISSLALDRGVDVVTTYCESHTKEIPFHVGARLLRNVFGISTLDDDVARARVRGRLQDSDPEDVALLEDLLGIREPSVPPPVIDPDARRRRVAALLNASAIARTSPAVFIVEDAHWIDDVSESMIADLGAVVPQTHSLVLITYRPEYHGALDRLPNAHRIALAPLDDSASAALATEFLGCDPSVALLVAQVAERAGGNPFFVEEIVRDLAERGVIEGEPGAYVRWQDSDELPVPASLKATIAARIDRLDPIAKRTLNAAAVIGLRFDSDLLARVTEKVDVAELVATELVDQVTFTSRSEYAFRHPLVRTVAYESQLKSDRSQLHRRLANAIEQSDENAALIAEHFEAGGDLREAYDWHVRAATLADSRDARAARKSWQRASQVADRLPVDDQDRMRKRIASRIHLCAGAWRMWGTVADTGIDELDALCTEAGDSVSKAIGMSGLATVLVLQDKLADAARVATDIARLVESIGDPTMIALLTGAGNAKLQGGEPREGLRMVQTTIDVSQDDSTAVYFGIGALGAVTIAIRGSCRYSLGIHGWRDDLDQAIAMSRSVDPTAYAAAAMYKYAFPIQTGALLPDAAADRDTADALEAAEQASDDFALEAARIARGLVLIHGGGPQRTVGYDLLKKVREGYVRRQPTRRAVRFVDTEFASAKAMLGDLDAAVELARVNVDFVFGSGDGLLRGPAIAVLVESLLKRGTDCDFAEAESAIERLAAVPIDPGFVLHELPLLRLRALLARANDDEAGYQRFVDQYRAMANDLGFEGHMAIAAAM